MVPKDDNPILSTLRRLVASDPKQARVVFQSVLEGPKDALDALLRSVSQAGDGRLRHMIAIVFRSDPKATSLEPWLKQWLGVEPDEFTRSAIATALSSREETPHVQRSTSRNVVTQTVEAYRYVADRLCHRVRNALSLPSAQLARLEYTLRDVADPTLKDELTEILGGLQIGLGRISRIVEFDTGDEYLAWQTITLVAWLETAAADMAARFGPAQFAVSCDASVRRCKVRATRFLLETIFGNLWSNAVQAIGSPCCIGVECTLDFAQRAVELQILDNGPGFAEQYLESVFQQAFSTKSASRGRGLLEVAESVLRLQGTVELVKGPTNEYRIAIRLPVETL